jgi:type II secretory pathway predicted ATPase ExeA
MDETHTRGYVEHHLKLAGRKARLFSDEALLQRNRPGNHTFPPPG